MPDTRCSDGLPEPLRSSLVVRTWECIPDPERYMATTMASTFASVQTVRSRDEILLGLFINGLTIPAVRVDAFRNNYAIQYYDDGGEIWRANLQWMSDVWSARLLGCCPERGGLPCYIRSFL